jgi:urease accessory protein
MSHDEGSRPVALARAALGNLATYAVDGRLVERISIASDDLAKRVLRLAGATHDVGVRLSADTHVRDGDVVFADAERVIALAVQPDDVLVCRPGSIARASAVAHALGNRHLPIQLDGDAIVIRADRLVEELLDDLGAPFDRESRTLAQPFRHANAPHAHG